MRFTPEVLQDVFKVEFLTEIQLRAEWGQAGGECVRAFIRQQQEWAERSALTYMCVLLVKLLVPFLQDVIWVSDVLFDGHGLESMENDDAKPVEEHGGHFLDVSVTFSLAFSLEGASIQRSSSNVSTYAFWIFLMRSLTCNNTHNARVLVVSLFTLLNSSTTM